MTNNQLAAALKQTSSVLLDFDGPICSVFSTFTPAAVARELRTRLQLDAAPETNEPFQLLSYVADCEPTILASAEAELSRLESSAVLRAAPTPGAKGVLRHLREAGRPVVVVSNNSADAVRTYLAQHDLTSLVAAVSSRTDPDPTLLKPHPYLLLRAADLLDTAISECLMVGDSATDIEAAHAAGAIAVGYANKPGKREQFERIGAAAVIDEMGELLGLRATL